MLAQPNWNPAPRGASRLAEVGLRQRFAGWIGVVMICEGLPIVREGSTDVNEGSFERGRVVLPGFEDVQTTHIVGPIVL